MFFRLVFYVFLSCCNQTVVKRSPFGLQNESFYLAKGVLLHTKTSPFTGQKDYIWKPAATSLVYGIVLTDCKVKQKSYHLRFISIYLHANYTSLPDSLR